MNLFVLMFFCESVHINPSFLKSKPWGLSDPLSALDIWANKYVSLIFAYPDQKTSYELV